jgi:dTDP-4-amino-4,6-dideoxygalactose transaminase
VRIPSIDLAAEYRSIQPEIDMAIRSVLESGSFINGENVQAFEAEAASYLG